MKPAITALILALMFAGSAFAEDHLYPERSILGGDAYAFSVEYDQQLAAVFKDAMGDDVVLRMIFLPSFISESAVGIRKRAGVFEIFSLHAAEQVWNYRERHAGKVKIGPRGKIDGSQVLDLGRDDPGQIPVQTCSIEISPSVESILAASWERSLRAVRFGGQNLGADGATYHFAMRKVPADRRSMPEFLAGQISSEDGPRVRALIGLAWGMDKYCQTRDRKMLNALTSSAQSLVRSFP